jgi:flagellar basal-body rod modification protein FlgD
MTIDGMHPELRDRFFGAEAKPRVVNSGGIVEEGNLKAFEKKEELGKQDFLNLLVTQLRHQDPMQPTANEEFVAQLAQFSALEASQNIDKSMTDLSTTMNGFVASQTQNDHYRTNAAATSLLGKDVKMDASLQDFDGRNPMTINVQTNSAAPAYLRVFDAEGKQVSMSNIERPAGANEVSLTWDGKNSEGKSLTAGQYYFMVTSTATGTERNGYVFNRGTVQGLRYTEQGVMLTVDGKPQLFGDIKEVETPKVEG